MLISLRGGGVDRYSEVWDDLVDDESRRVLLRLTRHLLLWEPMPRSAHEQYFDPDIIKLTEDEVFVDGGFFTGDTAIKFIERTNNRFRHIFGFEPDGGNVGKSSLNGAANVTIVEKGLWSGDDVLNFSAGSNQSGSIGEGGDVTIPVTSIDNYFRDIPFAPTYIKLDVEGAEARVLRGAADTIKTHGPKLAVSVYHKPEDMYELPALIRGLCGDYKFYLRHYSNVHTETVLYAVL